MTHETETAKPVQDWENRDVRGMALCCESIFEERIEKIKRLRAQQSAYEDSLPMHADGAFKGICSALPDIEAPGEKEHGVRAALRIYNIVFTRNEPLEEDDIQALYWLNCRAEDAFDRIESGTKRANDIARKQIRKTDAQAQSFQGMLDQMEPEVAEGMKAMLKAVVNQRIPVKEAYAVFEEVVEEHRAKTAA